MQDRINRTNLRYMAMRTVDLSGIWECSVPGQTGSARLRPDLRRWDLEEGNLVPLTVSADGLESRTVFFGVRSFAVRGAA